jgi:hypothetical protein
MRGFYDDPIGIKLRHEVGVDHIIWGSDFPPGGNVLAILP